MVYLNERYFAQISTLKTKDIFMLFSNEKYQFWLIQKSYVQTVAHLNKWCVLFTRIPAVSFFTYVYVHIDVL
jgi:hypothetical protein